MKIIDTIALILVIIGAINLGLIGLFNFNLVEWIFSGRNAGSIIIYILVLLSTLWLIFSLIRFGAIYIRDKNNR